jgi:hypothetical protein
LNRELVTLVSRERPGILFIYRGTHISKETLQAVKAASPSTVLIGYNNDDPFGPGQPALLWRHFLKAIPYYDLVLAYRERNIEDFKRAGARRVELLRSWFVPEWHRPVNLSGADEERYRSDVVFVGHYEADGRLEKLEALAAAGLKVRIFGPGRGFRGFDWDPVLEKSAQLKGLAPVRLVWGDDYAKALCGSKVALCFLSKLNRDTYTRRCFEIPSTRTLMLSEYSDDLAGLFCEGTEVEFFRSTGELVEKAKYYAAHAEPRAAMAEAGRRKVVAAGHDVRSRMQQVLAWANTERVQTL